MITVLLMKTGFHRRRLATATGGALLTCRLAEVNQTRQAENAYAKSVVVLPSFPSGRGSKRERGVREVETSGYFALGRAAQDLKPARGAAPNRSPSLWQTMPYDPKPTSPWLER